LREPCPHPTLYGRRIYHRGAFTVLELLVVIGIIALLVGVLLPALGHARLASRSIQSASNLRQLHVVLQGYSADNADLYPVTIEGRLYQVTRDQWVSFGYWQAYETWPGVVYDRFPTGENWEVYTSPLDASARGSQRGWPSSYEYSTSFIGDPRIWSGDATAEERWLVGQRESAVLMPSAKAFLWDQGAYPEGWTPQDETLGVQTAMADGSVRPATLARIIHI